MNEMQIWVIALFQLWQNSIHGLGIRIRSRLLCIVRVSTPPWLSAHFTATCINIYTFIHQPRVLIRIIFSLLFWSDNRIWLFLGLNSLLNHLCTVFIILKRSVKCNKCYNLEYSIINHIIYITTYDIWTTYIWILNICGFLRMWR